MKDSSAMHGTVTYAIAMLLVGVIFIFASLHFLHHPALQWVMYPFLVFSVLWSLACIYNIGETLYFRYIRHSF